MKHLFLLSFLLFTSFAQAQDALNPNRVRWTAPLSASTVKTLVDATGNTWTLNAPNAFQVFDPQGKVSWTKTLSALTVADFTVDTQGQLLLVGLPATGRPILEKYDASQTVAWRNTLDSLSNVPGQAGNLSVTTNSLGSGLVLGVNASSDQKLTYYYFTAGGQLGAPVSVTGTKQAPVTVIRPVLINANDMILGINQPQTVDAFPRFVKVQVGATNAAPIPFDPIDRPNVFALTLRKSPYPATLLRSLPLLPDRQNGTAWALIRVALDTTASKATPATGYALYPNPGDYKAPLVFATDDVKSVGEASSRFLDSKGRLFTTPIVSTATTSADLLLNQYVLNESGIKPLLLINSLKLGTVVQSAPAGSVSVANRLTILNRNADGSVVLAGTTSGTVTIGSSRFAGSPAAPAQFLVTIGPEPAAQTLTTDQLSWALSLPAATRRVTANGRQQTWVQLPDSVFRYYDPKGRLVWEKKLVTQGVYEIGADLKGNLYIMSADSVNTFDSTGTFRWKLAYRKGPNTYDRRLYIKPTGGGVATCIADNLNGNQRVTEFTDDGKDISQFLTWNWGGSLRDSYSLANLIPLSSKQMAWFFVNNRSNPGPPNTAFPLVYNNVSTSSFVENVLKWKTYSIQNIDPDYSTDTLPLTTRGLHIWSRAAPNAVYLFQSQNTILPAQQRVLTYGYSLTRFDSTGRTVFDEANTLRINRLAVAKSVALNPARTLFTLYTNGRLEAAATTSYDLVLSQYDPDLNLRNTTQLGTFTLVNVQPDKTGWSIVEAYADGSLLLSGITSGTLTIGTNTYAGSSTAPARFLALINTTLAQVTAPATAICQSSTATIKARYKGYLDQQPVVQLSNAAGSFAQPALSLTVPLSRSAVADTTLTSLSLPIPTTLAAGTYRLRTLLGTFASELTSLTVLTTPTASTVTQQGDELVSTTSAVGARQWYNTQNQPISGATDVRYKPTAAGSYYVINTANGCTSAPSNTIDFVITATEPVIEVAVYPNPAADRLFVRWPGATAGARIRLLNAQGRIMQDVPRQGDVTDVPTQGLTSGLVFVQMQVEGQPILVRKVLIQR